MPPALAPDQQRAFELATDPRARARIMVLTGAPGTGKSYTVRSIVEESARRSLRVSLAAPTGKAARRLAQLSGYPATTIHRLLEPRVLPSGRFSFARGPGNPLDCDVLALDEVSMLDVHLAARVLTALRPHARLILVGDMHQLPAVGPGVVLGDLLASGKVPAVELDTIKRQRPGQIVLACHAIKAGRAPAIASERGDDLFLVEHEDPQQIRETVLELVLERLPRALPAMQIGTDDAGAPLVPFAGGVDPIRDIQVISPTRERGPLSCASLNAAFQARVHGLEEDRREDEGGDASAARSRRFLRGDKLVQTRNDYELGVCNGDIGYYHEETEDEERRKLHRVAFEPLAPGECDRLVDVPAKDHNLELAYAVTCHRYQGSEAPVVVIPVHSSMPSILMTRNWLYTAISRARTLCILVGEDRAITAAVKRVSPTRRITGLASMLRLGASRT